MITTASITHGGPIIDVVIDGKPTQVTKGYYAHLLETNPRLRDEQEQLRREAEEAKARADEWIEFEGRMVRRHVAEAAEKVREEPYRYAGPGSFMDADPYSPAARAEKMLDESSKEYMKIRRKQEREEREEREHAARLRALSVDLPLTSVDADPEVMDLRSRIEAGTNEARAKLEEAQSAYEIARIRFEDLDRAAIDAEIEAELEIGDAEKAKRARSEADKAAAELSKAEAKLKAAEQNDRRQAQRAAVLGERLRAAEDRARETLEREGKRLLREEIARARAAIEAAAAANLQLFRVTRALDQLRVPFTYPPHFRPLLSSADTGGQPTDYDKWLKMISEFYLAAD